MQLSYSLMYAQGNMSDPTEGYSSYREEDAALRPNRNYPLDFDQRHKINLTLITKTPLDFGPRLFGFYPFELFTFTGIFTAGSGLPYTPTSRATEESNIVPEPNSARRPWVFNLDLKISRQIPINPLTATIYLDIEYVFDAVVVDYHRFDRGRSREVAHDVARLNAHLTASGVPYVLIGVGRWGSRDPWLGIPVTWDQVSGARVIVEAGMRDLRVTPSQGSHFFQNLTAFNVGYFTINPDIGEGDVDWAWLDAQPPLSNRAHVRHIRLTEPMVVAMNGKNGGGVVLKPA